MSDLPRRATSPSLPQRSTSPGVRPPSSPIDDARASLTSLNSSANTYLSNMWGIIRRFSTEDSSTFGSQLSSSLFGDPQSPSKDGINGVFNPVARTASPFRPPPLDPLVLHGYKDSTPDTAKLLSHAVAEEVRAMVPERLRILDDWRLVYSLEQDGASLSTLYQMCRQYAGRRVGFVLVVKDQEGAVSQILLGEHVWVWTDGSRRLEPIFQNTPGRRQATSAMASVSSGAPRPLTPFRRPPRPTRPILHATRRLRRRPPRHHGPPRARRRARRLGSRPSRTRA